MNAFNNFKIGRKLNCEKKSSQHLLKLYFILNYQRGDIDS